ncbi:hypothetical protein QC762_101395 [Podospora pseudocomata]|uniref:Uncharacterized protein n=1 Tax=Podospora pseudocomata TaxID=2093779 RepID=A0ABR0GRV0_9PEZI|nr:hypothetical protein QC762_101395 [Podospora pseudocomata]
MTKSWDSGTDLSANPERLLFTITRENMQGHDETDLIPLYLVVSGIKRLFRFIEFTSNSSDHDAQNRRQYQYADGKPALKLLKSGCRIGFNQEPHCTSTCTDPDSRSASTSTLANGVTLASAEVLIRSGSLAWPLDSDDMVELRAYGVNNIRDWNGSFVLGSVLQSAVASCQAHDGLLGNCSPDLLNLQRVGFESSSSLLGLQSALTSYCEGTDVTVNADVAGPGVLFSHIAQTLMVLVAYGLMNILNSWTYPVLMVSSTSGHGIFESALQHHELATGAGSSSQRRVACTPDAISSSASGDGMVRLCFDFYKRFCQPTGHFSGDIHWPSPSATAFLRWSSIIWKAFPQQWRQSGAISVLQKKSNSVAIILHCRRSVWPQFPS